MPDPDIDLLAFNRGTVTAPAGCGKTHLIANTLARHTEEKPILVLTHTNAGVAALRGRLDRAGVPSKVYRLSTIDGWAMKLISTFPGRSAHNPSLLKLSNPSSDYPGIRSAAIGLLRAEHVSDILDASYSRLMVDEYQDCSTLQHALVDCAAAVLPTCVLGDPLQAIFGFGSDRLANWDGEVCRYFPVVGELKTPWRWINAGADRLGHWLLGIRSKLLQGKPVDLCEAPDEVTWVELDGTEDHPRRLKAARVNPPGGSGSVLIIGDSTNPSMQRQFAGQTPGAVTVEAVDLRDLISFANVFDVSAPSALEDLSKFAESVMTNVDAAGLVRRINSITSGRARKDPTDVERAALAFVGSPSHERAVDLLVEMGKESAMRTHRPAVLRACLKALQHSSGRDGVSFYDAALRLREHYRVLGRPLPRRAVGSTLLLKGLEAEVAVILNADVMNARNLYVAMTRGSRSLVVCSHRRILRPAI